ncbi:MAG: 50S ribosomal protein L4 [Candidatus Omnitrophica bacterium]|nr:50S ribosomal protein L4 [Candidatus Omnitrophota bacterium]
MTKFELSVLSQEGKKVEKIELDPEIFDGQVNQNVIYQAVRMYRANQRKGQANTRTREEVSGSGAKPWRQKGTGRARAGSIRSPLWRGGGVVFGPHPRDFSYSLPKRIRILALKSSLNAKLKDNNFLLLKELKINKAKTKEAVVFLDNLKLGSKNILLLLEKMDENIKRATKNIRFFNIDLASSTNAYEILGVNKVLITKAALSILTARIKNGIFQRHD